MDAARVPAEDTRTRREDFLETILGTEHRALRSVVNELFPRSHVLLPQLSQLYELDLAYGEFKALSDDELGQRGAYFQSINGLPTHHFRMCMNTPGQVNASARQERKNFFAANVFAVGYATHGLFPYRGKFHPQMIKAVMNMMGLRPGDTVLDPMGGCGTTAIEASLMGLNSVLYELSPFGCLMTRAKLAGLDVHCDSFVQLAEKCDLVFERLDQYVKQLSRTTCAADAGGLIASRLEAALGWVSQEVRDVLLLCYFDAVGYANRRCGKTPQDLFPALLSRYLSAVAAFNEIRCELGLNLGSSMVVQGDARELLMPPDSIDGVLFSPPYSFAIDYVENDRSQLEMLGVDPERLKERMVGLVGEGRTAQERVASRVANYFADMEKVLGQCMRVLRRGRYCVVVVGSNTNQTGGVSLEDGLIDIAEKVGLPLEFQIVREIEGIRNTMREESILFLRKPHETSPEIGW
jgi:ubiquinone/menaquinone biosynthesis C-methylase UbiE